MIFLLHDHWICPNFTIMNGFVLESNYLLRGLSVPSLATVLALIYHSQSNQIRRDKSLCLIYSNNFSQSELSSLIYHVIYHLFAQFFTLDVSFIL